MKFMFWRRMRVKDRSSVANILTTSIAEYFASGIYVFIGYMGTYFQRFNSAVCFGFAMMVAVQCSWHISGGYVNPIITIAGVIAGQLPLLKGCYYIFAQLVGAVTGLGIVKALLIHSYIYGTANDDYGYPGVYSWGLRLISNVQALFIEFLISFILIMVVCGIWDYRNVDRKDSIPLRLGLTVLGLSIAAGPFTEGHLNPARTLAPAILNNSWKEQWIYFVGQLSGSVISAILYSIIFYSDNGGSNENELPGRSSIE